MDKGSYSAKKILFRKIDKRSDRVPGPIPGVSKWLYTDKDSVTSHLKQLLKSISVLEKDVSVKMREITKTGEFPIPITVKMYDKMIAKSHRPVAILREIEAYVISVQELGKIIVGVTEKGVKKLICLISDVIDAVPDNMNEWTYYKELENGELKLQVKEKYIKMFELIHELTSIEDFYSYSNKDILHSMGEKEKLNAEKDGKIKIRFFNYSNPSLENKLMESFIEKFKNSGITESTIRKYKVPGNSNTYIIPYINGIKLSELARFPGIEEISSLYRFNSTLLNNNSKENLISIIKPKSGVKYPKMALVDSGISINNKYLSDWVEERVEYIKSDDENNEHADFIGGLLLYGKELNKNLDKCLDTGIKILDVVVLPDKDKGELLEDDLIMALMDSLDIYSDTYKVWNLSLNCDCPISGIISEFTAAIDELQKMYDVIFVISAGNYDVLRSKWPVNNIFEDDLDRISPPADSIRAITVGSIAIDSDKTRLVDKNMVTPYSRRGPGVGLTIKPDIVHYSGNLGEFSMNSINKNGQLVRGNGTSFSAPLVTSILSEYFNIYPENLSTCLAKALLIHGSRSPISGKNIDDIKENYYYGFGLPRRLDEFLDGNEHEITLIFEGDINAEEGASWIRIADFPFPESLCENNKIRGEIIATLYYEPHLDSERGSEYCRSNLDIRLRTKKQGEYETISKNRTTKNMIIEEKWERDRMAKELKWSPIKQIKFSSPRGKAGSNNVVLEVFPTWRDLNEKRKVHFAVVVTIRDPKKKAPVYNDVNKLLLSSFRYSDINLNDIQSRVSNR